MSAAHALVECLKRADVEKVFCVPGESYLPVLDALYDAESIEVISARHEGGAAFMAEGYAKAASKAGIVFATRGVGAANLSIGVHTAMQDSTPMLVFLGQVHRKFRGREGFQEVELTQFFAPIVKWAVEVKDPERMPEIVERAFRIAETGRPGPVIISLPEDVLPLKGEMQFGPLLQIPRPTPSENDIQRVEETLSKAKRPIIIAGGGVKRAEAILQNVAEKFAIPVLAAFRRHDVFPHHHPLYAGHLGLGTDPEIVKTVEEADVILALGTRLSEITTQDYSIITPEKKLIHIDIDFDALGKVYAPDVGIVADIKEALTVMGKMTVKANWVEWVKERRRAYTAVSNLDIKEGEVMNKQIIHALAKNLPDDALLTTDAGNFAGWLHAFFPFKEKQRYIGPTSGAMGYGMPAALGAKLAFPSRPVIALSGDGGFMMTVQELETAVRHRIPVICLVFNNNMYGTIRMHQEMHYPERVIGTDLGYVSFKDLAKSVGADGYLVNTAEHFEQVLRVVLSKNNVAVIEILTSKEEISVSSTISKIRKS
ncbi:thiamine pyrophosphate-dependent enzyme [Oceanobacillus alkalisoli]|uniref:thiamine pyrophosphate-dependent enzyme n=1 Tax=Oceanobacillus alkalisoli TaxID=2925113 RepID=UPI001F11C239|nr:thiamine pyrophosphate-dependent enzyme [Oceanobacillus alkalisoli]MCF3942935.1 thiamine pyrophosphate-dependent enzyme [Oceanobacillus alkalisoli]